jgi:DNA-binding MarR family transcriptional regulator
LSSETPAEILNQGPYLGAKLRLGWQLIREQLFSGVLAAGFDDLNPAHVGVFRYPTLDGQRPSEIAEQMQITRQSVNDLLGHLERRGYLTRGPDLTDRRGRVVRLTAEGRRLEQIIKSLAQAAELNIAMKLGPQRYSQLHAALKELEHHITQDGH